MKSITVLPLYHLDNILPKEIKIDYSTFDRLYNIRNHLRNSRLFFYISEIFYKYY